jgi:hypothetical protein
MDNLYKFYDRWLIPLMFGLLLMTYPTSVNALADSLGFYRSYQVSCTSSAAKMCRTGYCSFQAFKFWVNSSTPVYMGGSDVDTSTKGMPYCTDSANCVQAMESVDGSPSSMSCVSGGTVTVTVIAGRK